MCIPTESSDSDSESDSEDGGRPKREAGCAPTSMSSDTDSSPPLTGSANSKGNSFS